MITPAARGERRRDTLRAGDPAPDFTRPDLAGQTRGTQSDFRGRRPVVLVFAGVT